MQSLISYVCSCRIVFWNHDRAYAFMRGAGRLLSILCACLISAWVLAAFEREPMYELNAATIRFDAAQFSVNMSFSAAAPHATQSQVVAQEIKDSSAKRLTADNTQTAAIQAKHPEGASVSASQNSLTSTKNRRDLMAQNEPLTDVTEPQKSLATRGTKPEIARESGDLPVLGNQPLLTRSHRAQDATHENMGSEHLLVNGTEALLALPENTKPSFAETPIAPSYPKLAQKRGQQGTVWLEIWLDQLGYQTELKVHNSSGVSSLDKAALKAVSSWKFLPLTQDGQAIASRVQVPVEFVLN